MSMPSLQNLFQMMALRGCNIPQNMTNNPHEIINYLLQNGKITQEQYNNAKMQAQRMFPQNQNEYKRQ